MTICQALAWAKENLNNKTNEGDFCESRLQDFGFGIDAEILLSYVLKKNKEFLLTYPECEISKSKFKKFQILTRKRAKGAPVAYLTNHKEFFGLDFYVDERALIPRPETEMLVDFIIHETCNMRQTTRNTKHLSIVDVGTGSGCIAISLAKTLMTNDSSLMTRIYATDISRDALAVARKNARRHKVDIKFLQGDLLEPLIKKKIWPDIIIANLPYLKPSQITGDIKYEPRSALVGGADGLRYYEKLLRQVAKMHYGKFMMHDLCNMKQLMLFEIDTSQAKSIKKMIKKSLSESRVEIKKDLAGLERIVMINY